MLLVSNDLVIGFCGRRLHRRPFRRQTAPSSGVAASQAAPPLPSQPSCAPHSSLSRDNTLRPPFPSVQRCLLALPVLSQPPQRLIRRWPADLPNAPPAADSFQRPKPSAPCLTARQFRLPTLPSSPTTSSRAFRPTSPRPTQTAPGWSAICRASFPAASWSTRQHCPKIKTVHQPPDRLADRPLPLLPQNRSRPRYARAACWRPRQMSRRRPKTLAA